MKYLSKANKNLKIAIEKGYYTDIDGNIFSRFKKLKPNCTGMDYFTFNVIGVDGKSRRVLLHKLQAYQKFGDKIFEEGIVVRHLDGNSLNNSWDNIEIGTQFDNINDISKEIRIKKATLASRINQNKTRSYDERCKIYDDIISGITCYKISKKYNINSGTIYNMKNKSLEYQEYLNKSDNERK